MKVALDPALVQAVFAEMGRRGGTTTMARKSKKARIALARKAARTRWGKQRKKPTPRSRPRLKTR
jgi:hypothetical protein